MAGWQTACLDLMGERPTTLYARGIIVVRADGPALESNVKSTSRSLLEQANQRHGFFTAISASFRCASLIYRRSTTRLDSARVHFIQSTSRRNDDYLRRLYGNPTASAPALPTPILACSLSPAPNPFPRFTPHNRQAGSRTYRLQQPPRCVTRSRQNRLIGSITPAIPQSITTPIAATVPGGRR